jgi:hypothetical protein
VKKDEGMEIQDLGITGKRAYKWVAKTFLESKSLISDRAPRKSSPQDAEDAESKSFIHYQKPGPLGLRLVGARPYASESQVRDNGLCLEKRNGREGRKAIRVI